MEQHPIPQNISSYQFRLVGDMTLKQFFQLAGGIVVGLIFYSSPLLPIIKWPFTIGSALLGVLLAFVPLEERPLVKLEETEQGFLAKIAGIFSSLGQPVAQTPGEATPGTAVTAEAQAKELKIHKRVPG